MLVYPFIIGPAPTHPSHLFFCKQTAKAQHLLLIGFAIMGGLGGWYILNWHVPPERINVDWHTFPTLLADTLQTQLFVFTTGFPNSWQLPASTFYFALYTQPLLITPKQEAQNNHALLLGVYFLFPIVMMALLRTVVGVYATRYLITIAPAFYGLVVLSSSRSQEVFDFLCT